MKMIICSKCGNTILSTLDLLSDIDCAEWMAYFRKRENDEFRRIVTKNLAVMIQTRRRMNPDRARCCNFGSMRLAEFDDDVERIFKRYGPDHNYMRYLDASDIWEFEIE